MKRLPVYLEQDELAALLTAARPQQRLYFLLCARAGLRSFEACQTRHEDIIWQDGEPVALHVIGKGAKEALLPLSAALRSALPAFTSPARRGWLFPGRHPDSHLSVRAARYWMESACARAGLGRHKARLHGLRHSFATHMLRRGVVLNDVQELMRHESIRTTSVYLHTTPERLQAAVDSLDRSS